jgi:hypothetical protein
MTQASWAERKILVRGKDYVYVLFKEDGNVWNCKALHSVEIANNALTIARIDKMSIVRTYQNLNEILSRLSSKWKHNACSRMALTP